MKTQSQVKVLLSMFLILGTTSAFSVQTAPDKKTATSQMRGSASDVEITRRIRDRITDDKTLSMNAQNITIVTLQDGITLKGEVASQAESARVLAIAREYAGGKSIHNELTIEKK